MRWVEFLVIQNVALWVGEQLQDAILRQRQRKRSTLDMRSSQVHVLDFFQLSFALCLSSEFTAIRPSACGKGLLVIHQHTCMRIMKQVLGSSRFPWSDLSASVPLLAPVSIHIQQVSLNQRDSTWINMNRLQGQFSWKSINQFCEEFWSLQILPRLFSHEDAKHLILKSIRCCHEVQQSDLWIMQLEVTCNIM